MDAILHIDADRFGQPGCFLQPRIDVTARSIANFGQGDDGAGAAGNVRIVAIENAQIQSSAGS